MFLVFIFFCVLFFLLEKREKAKHYPWKMTSVCPKDHLLILGEDKGRHLGVGPWMKGVQWQGEFNSLVTASLAQSSKHKPRAGHRHLRPGGREEEDPDGLLHSLLFGFLRFSVY